MKVYQAKDGVVRTVEVPAKAGAQGVGRVENHGDAMRAQGVAVEPARAVAPAEQRRDENGRWV
ncbi:hypothetical protein [Acidipila sp. EB88]|uniref:hypothetical protein n=1 Tax=Acidipila sp. EB88 TaxID=2305226 RepID=UPI000F5D7ECF|nr:hypothetical protein [Acidipila sp. EB88]RRA48230.1 hypothetical protein D1Y84_07950 [Acidipila sp. EB88]